MVYTDSHRLEQLETALEAAGIAWWHMELPSGVVFFSPNKAKMLGRESENFFHYNDFIKIVNPDDQERAMQAMRDLLEGKTDLYETYYRIEANDGSEKIFYDRGRIVARKGEEIVVAGIVFDVSTLDSDDLKTNVERLKSS